MRTRALGALAVAIAAVAILAGAGGARHTDTTDPNDVDGRFDLREVQLDHHPGQLAWRFRTFGPWSLDDAWDRGFFVIELDTRGDKSIDERILVRSDGRQLIGSLVTIRSDGTERVRASLDAAKEGSRSAVVSISLRRLTIGRSRETFTWYAYSISTSTGCRQVCVDRLPDDGRIEHELPGASPSPTVTPSPEPTGPTTEPTGPTTEPTGPTST